MQVKHEKVLVVDDNSEVLDLIVNQALKTAGYETRVTNDVNGAISELSKFQPDLLIASLHLKGLNAKDLLAMMRSQNNPLPVIVVAEEGQEQKVIQAFRLGAVDSIQWPAHEPEVINVVERCLEQIHIKREREALSDNLHRVNETLKQRVDDLVAVYNMGRSVTSITDLTLLFNTILENGLKVSHADIGWMLVLDEPSHRFVLEAYSNLPESFSAYLHKPWDDGISSIVAQSGKPYNAMGETLVDRKIGFLGKSVLIVPIKVRGQIRGVIVTMRKKAEAFTRNEQALLEALTDYASIALVNAFLLDSVKERAKRWEKSATFFRIG